MSNIITGNDTYGHFFISGLQRGGMFKRFAEINGEIVEYTEMRTQPEDEIPTEFSNEDSIYLGYGKWHHSEQQRG